jgi:hypothetical protein
MPAPQVPLLPLSGHKLVRTLTRKASITYAMQSYLSASLFQASTFFLEAFTHSHIPCPPNRGKASLPQQQLSLKAKCPTNIRQTYQNSSFLACFGP